jgi:hypothetical protein
MSAHLFALSIVDGLSPNGEGPNGEHPISNR